MHNVLDKLLYGVAIVAALLILLAITVYVCWPVRSR